MLDWKRPNRRLKNHECRLLLEKLHVAGLVNLPPLRVSGPRGPRVVVPTENGAPQELVTGSAGELALLTLTLFAAVLRARYGMSSSHATTIWDTEFR